MSAQITNNVYGNIGRMFARQNVSSVYGVQKATARPTVEEPVAQVDSVSLSPSAPRPLAADFLQQAMGTGQAMGDGESLSKSEEARLREDRIYAAMCALSMLGHTGESSDGPTSWPGGIPVPTRDELETARRRLAQRPSNTESVDDPEQLQQERLELMKKIGKSDLSLPFGRNPTTQAASA